MWTEIDVLYAMFLLKANCLRYETTIILLEEMETLCEYVTFHYADLFADRGITEEEFEGWLHPEHKYHFWNDAKTHLFNYRYNKDEVKIKWRYVEDP